MPVPRSLRQAGRQSGGLTGAGFDIGWRHAQNKEDTQEKAPCRQRLEKLLLWGVLGMLVLAAAVVAGSYLYVRAYLKSDGF